MSAESLRDAVFEQVAHCRESVRQGDADLSRLEGGVRAYCEAVAALPKAEGQRHEEDLQILMRDITTLGEELATARDLVRSELAGLGRLKQANVAYKKSDSIGPVRRPKPEEE